MEDFVLTKNISDLYQHNADQIRNYAQLLKQPPELWMFVPCSNGQPIYENTSGKLTYGLAVRECLFEGFEVVNSRGGYVKVKHGKYTITNDNFGLWLEPYDSCDGIRLTTISDLTKYNLPLTCTHYQPIHKPQQPKP